MAKLINRLALIATAATARELRGTDVDVEFFLELGLSLIFGGLLARAIARRKDLTVDQLGAGAAAFMGLGAVWALGRPPRGAAAGHRSLAAAGLLKITGILDFGTTIFTWQSLLDPGDR